MSIFVLSAIVNGLTSLILAVLVYLKSRKFFVNKIFIFFCLSVTLWSFFYFFWQIAVDKTSALFWSRALMGSAIFIPIFYLHFVHAFLEIKTERSKIIIILAYTFSLIFLIIDFTPYFIADVRPELSFPFWPTPAPLFNVFLPVWFFLVVYSTYLLVKFYKISSTIKKNQIKYILIGTILGYIGGSTNYFLWYGIPIMPYGNILASVYVGTVAYAIVKHHLMDIKIALRRSSVFLASVSLVIIMAAAIKYVFDNWFSYYSVFGRPLILITAVFIFPPLKNKFYGLANKYFFSSLYDSGEVIAALSERLRSTLTAEKIYEYIYGALAGAFHAKAFNILIYNEKTKRYTAQYNNDFNLDSKKGLPEDKVLTRMFIKKNQPIITEDADSMDELRGNKTIALLKKTGIEILAPLNVKDKTIGLIALGKKESGDMYNDDDLKVLETAGAQAAIALENALLYKESKNFGVKLEKEVERATRDLRQANEQLKKLDAAKSEFISIASHQLRTPLTVIKGYISMMLDGNFGVLTGPEKESLEKVFSSNERLIQLVENLLDVSRIESGQFEFSFKQADLNKLVADAADKLAGEAKEKNLILEYKPPAKPLPLLKLDQEKIKQVILNLIDNGIRYTKQGSVIITLELLKNKVKFCVSDSGMGIAPEDMINMFKKFSRGSGTSLVYTEGVGLNLYVARITIEAHQGKIWAESEGKGSKFCFELPAG